MSDKIKPHHLARSAILYVRQSTAAQVFRHRESQRVQYGMEKTIRAAGWRQIEVIDEDLGKSAAQANSRSGFDQMVAKVCLGAAGVVASSELSRLSRNSGDWQRLVEVCRVVDTLLMDHEALYDARLPNDRLLLGVKGSLNEYELDTLRFRAHEARRQKARRGEFYTRIPVGFVIGEDGLMQKDPDLRVQEAIALVFRKTLELGTARQAHLWFVEHGVDVPVGRYGPRGSEVVWRRPDYHTVHRILENPTYAGCYAYGKTEAAWEMSDGAPRKRIRKKQIDEWLVLLPDHHEGYVTREEFERIREMMARNAQKYAGSASGAPKRGAGLLSGLLRCARCGQKLNVRYTGSTIKVTRYCCISGDSDYAIPKCISLGGTDADEAVVKEVLRVVEPAAVEAARRAAREAAEKRGDAIRALELELQAARYTADRAWRQYDGADPENRLVAGELERRWNTALAKNAEIERRIDLERAQRDAAAPATEDAFLNLADDLDEVWSSPLTDVRLQKRLLRAVIEEIVVDVDPERGKNLLVIHWKGGVHTELAIRRRRRGEQRTATPRETVEAVRALTLVCPDAMIAGYLNRAGLRTGSGNRWTAARVSSLRKTRGIPAHSPAAKAEAGLMNLTEASEYLGVAQKSLRVTAERGDIDATHPLPDGPWIFSRGHLDTDGVRDVVRRASQRGRTGTERDPQQLSLL